MAKRSNSGLIAFGHRHPVLTGGISAALVVVLLYANFPEAGWVTSLLVFAGWWLFMWLWIRPNGIVARFFTDLGDDLDS